MCACGRLLRTDIYLKSTNYSPPLYEAVKGNSGRDGNDRYITERDRRAIRTASGTDDRCDCTIDHWDTTSCVHSLFNYIYSKHSRYPNNKLHSFENAGGVFEEKARCQSFQSGGKIQSKSKRLTVPISNRAVRITLDEHLAVRWVTFNQCTCTYMFI